MSRFAIFQSTCVGVALSISIGAGAGTIRGNVTDSGGKPVEGAMVTLSSPSGLSHSLYTNGQGQYALTTDLSGDLQFRARKRYHADTLQKVTLKADAEQTMNVQLKTLTDPQALSDDHPSLSHFSLIPFDEDEDGLFSRSNFARDCLTCHSLGNSFTRMPRSKYRAY